jgi:hypothetical protein
VIVRGDVSAHAANDLGVRAQQSVFVGVEVRDADSRHAVVGSVTSI